MLLGTAPIADLPLGSDREPQTLRFGFAALAGSAAITAAQRRRRFLASLQAGDAAITANLTRIQPLHALLTAQGSLSAALSGVRIPFLRLISQPNARRVYVAEFTVRRFK